MLLIVKIFHVAAIVNLFITLSLNIVWILVCIRECYRFVKRYLTCKRTSDLHPIYKDVQYLSRQRKLYNLETHIVKCVLVMLCLSAEVVGIVSVAIMSCVKKLYSNGIIVSTINKYQNEFTDCHIGHQLWKLLLIPQLLWLQNLTLFTGVLWLVLISILTRYLAARYLNHPFNKTLYRYIVWISVQFCILAFCSYKITVIFSILAFPLLSIINWLVLLRDNRILCRVLKSNLTELDLHSNNRVLYHEQVSSYRYYHFFQKLLLISSLLLVTSISFDYLTELIYLLNDSSCLLNIIYNYNSTLNIHIPVSVSGTPLMYYLKAAYLLIYSLSSSLPIICITLFPLIRACVKRYESRYMVYRYNYENIQPLIRR